MQILDDLLQRRTGGQINIRGLRFQLLYALLRSLELLTPGCAFAAIGLERFEDVDFYGEHDKSFRLEDGGTEGSNTYLQVKTCDGRWVWSSLKKPIKGFLEVLRADSNGQFSLMLNFALDGEPLELARFATQTSKKRQALTRKFQNLCQSMGGTSAEADALLARLQIVTISEEEVLRQMRAKLAASFELHGAGVDRYLSIFFERFLFWSRERKVVSREDLTRLRDGIAQDFALETAYEAFGRGVLVRANWKGDARPSDFFEGKSTRAGHIASDLDVRRPLWHERVKTALGSAGTVIIRASSGQGKSTLALRFACDEWPHEDTFVLKTAQTPAEVEMVCSVLRHRVNVLGLSTYVLLDNAGRQTSHWPRVAQECLALGIPILATLRQEDWYRFARTHRFSYEPVEPSLGLDEAKQIYRSLHEQKRIHDSVVSAEWAFEKIREPHLLMEFVYLLTHGEMLEDRLRDQISEIETHENTGKLEILRRVALADALSAPVLTDQLCDGVAHQPGFAGDARQLVRSLEGEYLTRHSDRLGGLHWVRSDHLVRLLHDDASHLADTALAVLGAVPMENLSDVISNALFRGDLDTKRFMNGIFDLARQAATTSDLPKLLALLEGVFEAGERRFLEANRPQFDEAHEFLGQAGPFLLKMDCAPTLKTTFLTQIRQNSGLQGEGLNTLLALSARMVQEPRGQKRAADLLAAFASHLQTSALLGNVGEAGDLLAWFGWCEVPCPIYDSSRDILLERVGRLDFGIEELRRFAEGLWIYDREGYRFWLNANPVELNGFLRWQLDLLTLEREDVQGKLETKEGARGNLSIEFFVTDYEGANKQSVDRVQSLYSLFPFYAHYNAQGVWPFPAQTVLWHDPSTKRMTQDSQYFRFHVNRNQTWGHVVESHYALDNYYIYQREWHELRSVCLEFLAPLSRRLQLIVTGKSTDFRSLLPESVIERLIGAISRLPHPPSQTSEELKKMIKPADEWAGHWIGFRLAIFNTMVRFSEQGVLAIKDEAVEESEENDAEHRQHLAWHNFRDVCKDLSAMQAAMRTLFAETADYFQATSLDVREKQLYAEVADLLDVWLKRPLPTGTQSVERYLAAQRENQRRDLIDRLHLALATLEAKGMTFVYPQNFIEDFPLKMLPLGFSVTDPCFVESVRNKVLDALYVADLGVDVDFFWLVPMQNGVRCLEGGFRAASRLPDDDDEQGWTLLSWTINEQPIPDLVWQALPQWPVSIPPKLKLIATLRALIAQIESFLRARDRVENLRASGDSYDAKLYEKHKARLLQEQSNLGVNFEELHQILAAEFAVQREEACFERAELVLNTSQLLSDNAVWDELPAPEDFSTQVFQDAVSELIGADS